MDTHQQLLDLANAIDVGAMLRPQAFNRTFSYDSFGNIWGSCALGAAAEATFFGQPHHYGALVERFPILLEEYIPNGGCALGGRIAELNDESRYTREQIAQWLRDLAGPAEPVVSEPVVEELVAEEVT